MENHSLEIIELFFWNFVKFGDGVFNFHSTFYVTCYLGSQIIVSGDFLVTAIWGTKQQTFHIRMFTNIVLQIKFSGLWGVSAWRAKILHWFGVVFWRNLEVFWWVLWFGVRGGAGWICLCPSDRLGQYGCSRRSYGTAFPLCTRLSYDSCSSNWSSAFGYFLGDSHGDLWYCEFCTIDTQYASGQNATVWF